MKVHDDVSIIRGAVTDSDWRVTTERGLVYDNHTQSPVLGMVLHVGHKELVVTDEQAELLIDYIRSEFMLDELKADIVSAKERHPSNYRRLLNENEQ